MQVETGLHFHLSKLILFGVLGLLFLGGCSSVRGYQEPLKFDLDQLIQEPTCPNANLEKECRNKYIDYYIIQSSINFSTFVRDLTSDRNTSGLIIDNLRTGLDAAIVVVTGAGPKTALGATSLGLGGLQGSIDKRLFYEATVPALVKFMDAKRSLILADILVGRSKDIDTYPLSLAIRDLQRFNDAGSISDAITSVSAEGAKQAEEAEKELTVTRNKEFVAEESQRYIEKLLGAVDLLADEKAWVILQSPPSELDDFTNSAVEARLGNAQLGAANAKAILKMILVLMGDRSEENLAKWEAAIISEQ